MHLLVLPIRLLAPLYGYLQHIVQRKNCYAGCAVDYCKGERQVDASVQVAGQL